MNITIRDVSTELWKKMKVKAIEEGLTLGNAINMAIDKWVRESYPNSKTSKSFWDIKPHNYEGNDANKLSMEVDEVLYS
tara:strand:- start:1723 stop:1959 length:237 start_codon:yes stop_codon:yes gene_type:complete